jgi:RNA polymerase sigma factor (sigma-70 family)
MHTTSPDLLDQLRLAKDTDAWKRFVDLYTPLLYYWVSRLRLSTEDAKDLVQEVFVILVRRLQEFTYDRQGSFRAWLRMVAINKWRDMQQRLARRPGANAGALNELPAPENDGFAEFEYRRALAARALQLIQARFEPMTWKAFWKCVAEGHQAADVARELAISPNAVYIAKSRVLTLLRRELAGLLD